MKAKLERKLTSYETIKIICSNMNIGIFMLEGKIDLERLKKAFFNAMINEPFFYLKLKSSWFSYKVYLKQPSRFDVVLHVTPRKGAKSWEKCAYHILNRSSSLKTQLYEFHLVYNENSTEMELILAFSHAFSDGLSTTNFVKEVLNQYISPNKPSKIPLEELKIPTPLRNLISTKKNRHNHKILSVLEEIFIKSSTKYPFVATAPYQARRTHFIFKDLEQTQLQAIKKQCEILQCSMQQAITFIAYKAFLLTFPDDFGKVVISTPVSFRKKIAETPAANQMSFLIYSVSTQHERAPSQAKTFIEDYHDQLKERIAKQKIMKTLPPLVSNYLVKKYCNDKNIQGRTCHLFVTSLGGSQIPFDLPEIKITRINSVFDAHLTGGMINVIAIIHGNTLSIEFIYATPIVSHEKCQDYIESFMAEFKHFITDT